MFNLKKFIDNPSDPIANFNLGLEYEQLNQTASAASFYLRAAEKTNDTNLQYRALIRNALCFEKQTNRDLTVKTLLQRAISIIPTRPEAYYFLSKLHEVRKEYHESYTFSSIGLEQCKKHHDTLANLDEYPGKYVLLFEKAVSGWWVGLTEQSREILFDLYYNYQLDASHKSAVENNLNNLGFPKHKFIYTKSLIDNLKHKFKGIEIITNNYAQVYQDMFVLTVLDGLTNGTYLEIGSDDPFYNSNTALLETQFGWHGISIDVDQNKINEFNKHRKNQAMLANALEVDYETLLQSLANNMTIDYLQIDCGGPIPSLEVLKKIISSGYKFKTITFGHDYYYDKEVREVSRKLLTEQGYKLLVSNVGFNRTNSFEDWWVLPEYVNSNVFLNLSNNTLNYIEDIFYNLN